MLTKKHFEVIADIISNAYDLPQGKTVEGEAIVHYFQQKLMDYFTLENENFDAVRFENACVKSILCDIGGCKNHKNCNLH